MHNSGASRRENAKLYPRHCEPTGRRFAPTRWLAMTIQYSSGANDEIEKAKAYWISACAG
jgi:hypothetical protein